MTSLLKVAIACLVLVLSLVALASATGTSEVVVRVAGDGMVGFEGDGGRALTASFANPRAVALSVDGTLIIADTSNNRVRVVDEAGVVKTIGGNGLISPAAPTTERVSATDVSIAGPSAVASAPDGSLVVGALGQIVRITTSGHAQVIAGDGKIGSSGDGGQAVKARVGLIGGIAFNRSGELIFSDTGNNRIRRIDAEGIISTVVGTGYEGDSGDGSQARLAKLNQPQGIAFDLAGGLIIADAGNEVVRRVDEVGNIATMAGNAEGRNASTGMKATDASLGTVGGIALGPDGTLYISSTTGNRIIAIRAGRILRVIGGGGCKFDSGPVNPSAASFCEPDGLAASTIGLYVADSGNASVRLVTDSVNVPMGDLPVFVVTGAWLRAGTVSADIITTKSCKLQSRLRVGRKIVRTTTTRVRAGEKTVKLKLNRKTRRAGRVRLIMTCIYDGGRVTKSLYLSRAKGTR